MPDHETQAKKDLEAQIEALEASDASGVLMTYDNYIAKLKTLNEITKEQYKKDRHGLNKPLTVIELDELRRIYREAGDEGQLMLDNLSHRKDSPTYALIKNIQDMLAKDLQTLNDATSMNRTSPEFKAILAAAKRYKGFCEANKGAVLSEDLYAIRRSMLKDVNKAAEAYVNNKRAKVKDPKPYTQHRIDTAERIAGEAGGVWQENFYENVMGQPGLIT